jgi:hypothetical protein
VSTPEYPATRREISTADMLAALVPDDARQLVEPQAAIPEPAALLAMARRQGQLAGTPEHSPGAHLPAVPERPAQVSPIVPRWVWQASARTALVAVVAGLVAFVVWGIAAALHAAAAAASAIAPVAIGVLAVAGIFAALGRRRTVEITQTQTIRFKR